MYSPWPRYSTMSYSRCSIKHFVADEWEYHAKEWHWPDTTRIIANSYRQYTIYYIYTYDVLLDVERVKLDHLYRVCYYTFCNLKIGEDTKNDVDCKEKSLLSIKAEIRNSML